MLVLEEDPGGCMWGGGVFLVAEAVIPAVEAGEG